MSAKSEHIRLRQIIYDAFPELQSPPVADLFERCMEVLYGTPGATSREAVAAAIPLLQFALAEREQAIAAERAERRHHAA